MPGDLAPMPVPSLEKLKRIRDKIWDFFKRGMKNFGEGHSGEHYMNHDDSPPPPLVPTGGKDSDTIENASYPEPPAAAAAPQQPIVVSNKSSLASLAIMAILIIGIVVSSAVVETEDSYEPLNLDGTEATIKGDLDGDGEVETVTEAPDLAGKKYDVTDDDGDGDKDSVRVGGKPVGKGDLYGNGRDVIIVETPAEPLGGFTGLDLDGDGKFDIIFIPEGSFLDFFDVDDDGDDELYLDAEKGGQTGVKDQDGDTDTDVYWVSNTVSHFDFDGDGMSNSFEISIGNDIYTMEVDMDGDDEMETISHDPTLGPNIAHAEDTDGDGDKDKIKTGGNPIDFVTWDDAVVIVIESGDETSGGCTPVDLDSDGKSDVVFVAEGDLLDVGDNDGDGKRDIIFLKSNDTLLYWKDFDGDGTVDVFFIPDNYTYITSEDLDGDGEPETIFSDSGLKELEVIHIDLDGDGDKDVIKIPEGDLLGTKDADGDGDTELILKGGNPWLAKDDDGDGDYDTIWLDDDGSPDDADDDGWSNGKEQEMGTNPLDPTNFPSGETPDRNDEDGDNVIDLEDQCPSEDSSSGLDSNQDGCLDQRPTTISVIDSSNNDDLIDSNGNSQDISVILRDEKGRLIWQDGDGPIYNLNPGQYTVEVAVNILNYELGMTTQDFNVQEGENTEVRITVSTILLPVKHIPDLVNGIASFIFGSLAYTIVRNATASRGTIRSFTMGAVAGAAVFGGAFWGLALGLG